MTTGPERPRICFTFNPLYAAGLLFNRAKCSIVGDVDFAGLLSCLTRLHIAMSQLTDRSVYHEGAA